MLKTASEIADIVLEKCANEQLSSLEASVPGRPPAAAVMGALGGGAAGATYHNAMATKAKDYLESTVKPIFTRDRPKKSPLFKMNPHQRFRFVKALQRIALPAVAAATVGYGVHHILENPIPKQAEDEEPGYERGRMSKTLGLLGAAAGAGGGMLVAGPGRRHVGAALGAGIGGLAGAVGGAAPDVIHGIEQRMEAPEPEPEPEQALRPQTPEDVAEREASRKQGIREQLMANGGVLQKMPLRSPIQQSDPYPPQPGPERNRMISDYLAQGVEPPPELDFSVPWAPGEDPTAPDYYQPPKQASAEKIAVSTEMARRAIRR